MSTVSARKRVPLALTVKTVIGALFGPADRAIMDTRPMHVGSPLFSCSAFSTMICSRCAGNSKRAASQPHAHHHRWRISMEGDSYPLPEIIETRV
jgi:hypothetical protein